MKKYDTIIIGAGAAGMSAAGILCNRKKRVAIIDMGPTPARKIMVSGGGRCNFTNSSASHNTYFGNNPNFVRSALSQIKPDDILNWAHKHKILPIEKAPGQYFSSTGAASVINALEHDAAASDIFLNTTVTDITHHTNEFIIQTTNGNFITQSVIIATGGLTYPNLLVSDFGMKIAKKFGHKIIPPRPALGAIKTDVFSGAPAGVSTPAEIQIGRTKIRDSIMFTHNGLGGPAIYRATVRDLTKDWHINLLPDINIVQMFQNVKRTNGRKTVANVLSQYIPQNLARYFINSNQNIADIPDNILKQIAARISDTVISQNKIKLFGLSVSEVTRGGISTDEINQKTMESKLVPNLYFAGEVMDITGDLGGFNLHWAFVSGRIAGTNASL